MSEILPDGPSLKELTILSYLGEAVIGASTGDPRIFELLRGTLGDEPRTPQFLGTVSVIEGVCVKEDREVVKRDEIIRAGVALTDEIGILRAAGVTLSWAAEARFRAIGLSKLSKKDRNLYDLVETWREKDRQAVLEEAATTSTTQSVN